MLKPRRKIERKEGREGGREGGKKGRWNLVIGSIYRHITTGCPPYLQAPHLRIQPTTDQKYLKKNSRKLQKAKLEFAT